MRLTWFRPDVTSAEGGAALRLSALEARTEVVALVSACCDLVFRQNRKGVVISPLRSVPKNVQNKPDLMVALRAPVGEIVAGGMKIPANLFLFQATQETAESVIYLEALSMIEFPLLKAGSKVAELTPEARVQFRERVKFHFAR